MHDCIVNYLFDFGEIQTNSDSKENVQMNSNGKNCDGSESACLKACKREWKLYAFRNKWFYRFLLLTVFCGNEQANCSLILTMNYITVIIHMHTKRHITSSNVT